MEFHINTPLSSSDPESGMATIKPSLQGQIFRPAHPLFGFATLANQFQIIDALTNRSIKLMGIDDADESLASITTSITLVFAPVIHATPFSSS